MESSRRFKPPWTLVRENSECYVVKDANGVTLAWLYCRDDAQRYSFGVGKLSSDEARRIGKAIARIPEFLMPRQGFYPRGGGPRWRADRPYHVALEDRYIREHWDEIDTLCKLNSLPFNGTGEVIESDGVWRVYEFTWQLDAILFWDRFEGRWLRGTEFHYPERPDNLQFTVAKAACELAEIQPPKSAIKRSQGCIDSQPCWCSCCCRPRSWPVILSGRPA
jgi:hypothetical protein